MNEIEWLDLIEEIKLKRIDEESLFKGEVNGNE